MAMYIPRLVSMLDGERPNWRKDTIIMLENAPYHRSAKTMKLFENYQVPVIFTGPHSYDAAPCELFFAAFKAADINPRHIPQGKW